VQMQSGTTGINTMRIYNPVKQGIDQDPTGSFVRAFVPELKDLPDPFIHEPWLWPGASALPYPPPIVDNVSAAKFARETLYAVRKGSDHRVEAREIVAKHGSRKSGTAGRGIKRKAKPMAVTPKQLTFDF
jgi:deoxyribodipyrimidine photo-lyase